MTTLAELDLNANDHPGIIEVRERLFCLTNAAFDAVVQAVRKSGHFMGHYVLNNVEEFMLQSSQPGFWGGEVLEVEIIDCRQWAKFSYGLGLSGVLYCMVNDFASKTNRQEWEELIDQIDAFIRQLTTVSLREWQQFLKVVWKAEPRKRPELFSQFGNSGQVS